MITITLVEHSGQEHKINASAGDTLMQAAVDNAVPGIDADCGGSCACGTCHIKVSAEWRESVGPAIGSEADMLDMTPESEEGSRLACQISLQPDHDGLVVTLPEFQM